MLDDAFSGAVAVLSEKPGDVVLVLDGEPEPELPSTAAHLQSWDDTRQIEFRNGVLGGMGAVRSPRALDLVAHVPKDMDAYRSHGVCWRDTDGLAAVIDNRSAQPILDRLVANVADSADRISVDRPHTLRVDRR